jgi:NAD(P)-dependent dehydrogenase (short-subunit alcohol dehydrogenase family)
MVGGGCRGLALARSLIAEGHAVRAVTRSEDRRAEIEAAGCECWIGDPDRIGTLRYALENATVLLWLLGTAAGGDVEALHGSRLEMMLERTVDTTVRGVLYERAGSVPADALAAGAAQVQAAHDRHGIPIAFLDADPREVEGWVAVARAKIDALLATAR